MLTVGYIGLGLMGKSIARNIHKAGFPLVVHNRSRAAVDELVAEGAEVAGSPAEVAAQVEVVFTNLPDTPDVEKVVLGSTGILEGARPGLIFVDNSTIKPAAARSLAARLAEGAVGRALTIDLGVYLASRQDALILLRTALREPGVPADRSSSAGWEPDYTQLFQATEKYRAGADGQEKTINLLRALGSLIEDLLLVVAGTPQLIRNLDLSPELGRLAEGLTVDWIDGAARALVQVEQGMRRNLLRSLSLDAMAVSLDRP